VADRRIDIPGLPPYDADDSLWNMSREFREDYVFMKHALAKRTEARRICEIGVYSGIAAKCFLAARPEASYVGIDNLSAQQDRGLDLFEPLFAELALLGYNAKGHVADSRQLPALYEEPYDLVHVDGAHDVESTRHDVVLAWKGLIQGGYVLVDNSHSPEVIIGTFCALRDLNVPTVEWHQFPLGVGNLLIRKP
jgi:predicted O-methyltransferase YrrM